MCSKGLVLNGEWEGGRVKDSGPKSLVWFMFPFMLLMVSVTARWRILFVNPRTSNLLTLDKEHE